MVAVLQMPLNRWNVDGAERRMFPRRQVRMRVEGKRLDHDIDALRLPHLSLSLQDISAGGLGAFSETPLKPGERLTVTIPAQGFQPGWDAYGRVIRCQPGSLGYRVAVEFDALPAA